MIINISSVHARCSWVFSFLLRAGGYWNNALNAGPSYRNANNSPTNSNRHISTHLELRYHLGSLEQRINQNLVFCRVKHTTNPGMSVSISQRVERSRPLVRLWWFA